MCFSIPKKDLAHFLLDEIGIELKHWHERLTELLSLWDARMVNAAFQEFEGKLSIGSLIERTELSQLKECPMEKATFGAGCFWGVEAAFQKAKGVVSTSVGYMGGHFKNPSYLDVLSRITGHAEVCQIGYDPSILCYEELLNLFWHIHDPTSLNRQGADRGEQYRSVIFYHTLEQEQTARRSKAKLDRSGIYDKAIVTSIQAASSYWLATEEHQHYFEKKQQR